MASRTVHAVSVTVPHIVAAQPRLRRYEGKVVVVLSAGSGVGEATAVRFSGEGGLVVVSDRSVERAHRVAASMDRQGTKAFAADVAQEHAVEAVVNAAIDAWGRLDVLVNNAEAAEQPSPIDRRAAADWHRIIDSNLSSAFYAIKHGARVMREQPGGGAIINVTTLLDGGGLAKAPAYNAARHGVVGLTKAAAVELAPHGIRVMAVQSAFSKAPGAAEDGLLIHHPLHGLATAEDVAGFIAYLASDSAAFLTGAGYLIDGAYAMQ